MTATDLITTAWITGTWIGAVVVFLCAWSFLTEILITLALRRHATFCDAGHAQKQIADLEVQHRYHPLSFAIARRVAARYGWYATRN